MLGAITVIITPTGGTASTIGVSDAPRSSAITARIISVIANDTGFSHTLLAIAIPIAATADAPIIGSVDDTNGRGRLATRPIGGVTEYAGTGDTFGVRTGAIAIPSTG